jgi:hypothetical protein
MWVAAYRGLNNLGQNTTAVVEGFNSSVKLDAKASRRSRRGRTVPWLLWLLYDILEPRFRRVRMNKEAGGVLNIKQIKAVRAAIEAAAQVPDSSITAQNAQLGHFTVLSTGQPGLQYDVRDVKSSEPHCDCPEGLRGRVCKHAVACMLLLGYSENEIWMLHGSLRGSIGGGITLELGAGVVRSDAPPAGSPKVPLDTQPPAQAQQADRPVDYRARFAAVLGDLQKLADSSSPGDPWLRFAVGEVERAAARVRSAGRECDDKAREEMVSLRESQSTRPDMGLQRQPDLMGRIQKGAGGSGKRQRVEADPPTIPVPCELVELRDASKRDAPRLQSLKEQVATLGADDDAENVAMQASQAMRSLSSSLPVAEAPPSAEEASFVALLLRADSP